jgi:hypothetical protein
MDATSFTTYQTNVQFNKLRASLGLNAVVADDDPSGKVDRFSGYLGIRKLFAKYSKGKIRGDADWTGSVAPGMDTTFHYDTSIQSYQLNYMFDYKGTPGFYVGIGYTSMDIPIEIHTLVTPGGKENQVYGVPVYDKSYKVKAYCFDFGFDTMLGEMANGKITPGDIKFFGHGEDTIGFGDGRISDETVAYAEALNPGRTFIDKKGFIVFLQNDTTMGMYWAPSLLKGHGIISLGYNLSFFMVGTFGGAADKASELGYDASYGMLRHGPQVRLYATW